MNLRNQSNLTIRMCRKHCNGYSQSFASLYKGDTCLCQDETTHLITRVEDESCDVQCTGNQDEACGGLSQISVYNGTVSESYI